MTLSELKKKILLPQTNPDGKPLYDLGSRVLELHMFESMDHFGGLEWKWAAEIEITRSFLETLKASYCVKDQMTPQRVYELVERFFKLSYRWQASEWLNMMTTWEIWLVCDKLLEADAAAGAAR